MPRVGRGGLADVPPGPVLVVGPSSSCHTRTTRASASHPARFFDMACMLFCWRARATACLAHTPLDHPTHQTAPRHATLPPCSAGGVPGEVVCSGAHPVGVQQAGGRAAEGGRGAGGAARGPRAAPAGPQGLHPRHAGALGLVCWEREGLGEGRACVRGGRLCGRRGLASLQPPAFPGAAAALCGKRPAWACAHTYLPHSCPQQLQGASRERSVPRVQVSTSVLSADGQQDLDVAAINAASAALLCSDIPWGGPVAAVRVTLDAGGHLHVNVPPEQQELGPGQARLRLLVAVTADRVVMVEAEVRVAWLPGCHLVALDATVLKAALRALAVHAGRQVVLRACTRGMCVWWGGWARLGLGGRQGTGTTVAVHAQGGAVCQQVARMHGKAGPPGLYLGRLATQQRSPASPTRLVQGMEVPEKEFARALHHGAKEARKLLQPQLDLAAKAG